MEVSAQVAAAADSFEAVHVKLALEGLHLPVAVILGEDLRRKAIGIENLLKYYIMQSREANVRFTLNAAPSWTYPTMDGSSS